MIVGGANTVYSFKVPIKSNFFLNFKIEVTDLLWVFYCLVCPPSPDLSLKLSRAGIALYSSEHNGGMIYALRHKWDEDAVLLCWQLGDSEERISSIFAHVSEFMIISRYDWTIKRHIATLHILWIQGIIGHLFPEAEDEMDL